MKNSDPKKTARIFSKDHRLLEIISDNSNLPKSTLIKMCFSEGFYCTDIDTDSPLIGISYRSTFSLREWAKKRNYSESAVVRVTLCFNLPGIRGVAENRGPWARLAEEILSYDSDTSILGLAPNGRLLSFRKGSNEYKEYAATGWPQYKYDYSSVRSTYGDIQSMLQNEARNAGQFCR